jgi:hypothetical protein
MFFRWVFVILVVVSLLGAMGIGASAQSQIAPTSNYCIFHVEAEHFPQVEIWLKPSGGGSAGFVHPDPAVYENGSLVPKENVQLKSTISVTLIIAIDQGRASNFRGDVLKKLKSTLRKLVDDGYLKDGRDIIRLFTLTSQNQTNAPLDIVYSVSDFTNWIDEHRFDQVSKGPTQALVAVEQSINKIRSDDSGRTPAIILFTHGVEDPATAIRAEESAQQVAQIAQNAGVLVFTIDTDNRQGSKGPLDLLAQKTEGKYVPITSKDFEGEVDDIYQSIFGRYVVVYTSTLTPDHVGEAETRKVSLAADFRWNESQNSCPPAEYQAPPLLRPVVSIPAADAGAEKIAEVTWPDGYTRTLAAVWCGPAAAKCHAQIDGTRVKYKVDASPSITITATIGVTDSFGLAGQRDFTLTPPAGPVVDDQSVNPLVIVVVGIAGLSMVGAISWLIIRRRKAPNRSPVSRPPQPRPNAAKVDSLPDWLEASLTILEGTRKRVIPLDKPRLILGRSPDKADIVFSFQSVSRIHCEILRDVGPAFKLINRSSTGGTWLNGRRIQAPVELKNGDEIVLGKPPKNGVKILFNYCDPEKTASYDPEHNL